MHCCALHYSVLKSSAFEVLRGGGSLTPVESRAVDPILAHIAPTFVIIIVIVIIIIIIIIITIIVTIVIIFVTS